MAAHTYLTALSPIEYRCGDPDGVLAGVRETLRTHEQECSPFRRCPMVHMVRLQVIDTARPAMGAQDAVPLQSSYLLLAAELDGNTDDFLVFRNSETEELNVMYRRKDGRFGLIEPEA